MGDDERGCRMDRTASEECVARIMADRTGTRPEDWYCVYRARHGMLAACEAIREVMGEGFVVTQLLTCCTAVDPILAAGLVPRYGEVHAATASLDPECLPLDSDVRAVVLQHSYGLIDVDASAKIADAAHEAGALVLEDCAHGVARMALGTDGAPLADVSFHSFGVEKMLHTQFGGAVWVNPNGAAPEVLRALRERLSHLPVAGARLTLLAGTFIFWNRVFNHLPIPVARGLRKFLSTVGLFEPAVSDEERLGGVSHEPMRPSKAICDAVIEAFGRLDEDMAARIKAARTYSELLDGVPGVTLLASAAQSPYQPLLKYPVLVADAATSDAACEACCAAGHYMTVWYRPELGPGVLDELAYHVPVDRSGIPVCDDMVQRILTLPTNQGAEGARAVVDVLKGVVSS